MNVMFALMRKEVLHILRDRRSLLASLMLPIIQVVLFGYAISFDVRRIDLAIVDQDHSPASRAVIATLQADAAVAVVAWPTGDAELEAMLIDGTARIGVVIPPGFDADLARGQNVPLQLLVDGMDASFAGQALGRLSGLLATQAQREIATAVRVIGGPRELPGLQPRTRVLFNESLNSTWYVIPGLMAVIVSMLAAMVTSQCVAREYEQGTIEQILVSPVSGPVLMISKLVPYVGLGVLQVASVVLASRFLFHVPLRGSLLLFGVATLLYLFGSMALGLMLSAVLKSQQVAMQISFVATMLPSLLLSGFIFPISNMPLPLQLVSYIVPARYFIGISRGLFLKGAGLEALWPDLVAMVIYATVLVLLAASRFRRSLA